MMSKPRFVPLPNHHVLSDEESKERAARFRRLVSRRRSVRDFSDRPVPREIIEDCLLAAGSAPSGANMQPWRFVVVSDAEMKRKIREGAEIEEREFYAERAPEEWLRALEPLGTDEHKPFLEIAPCLIAVFAESYGIGPDGRKIKHYYAQESVGIACGVLITALHNAGLACLTHTPSPMRFLNQILDRPENERPFLLLVVGHPAKGARVPDIGRKSLDAIAIFH
jgi:nitroreductase